MIKLNGKVVDYSHFPDNSLCILNLKDTDFYIPYITWYYENDEEMVLLYYLVSHIRDVYSDYFPQITLIMPYIPNARMDRTKSEKEVFTLKYFTQFINSLNFIEVWVFDPHSYVSEALINNIRFLSVKNIINYIIVFEYNNDIDLVLILGDITNFGPLDFVGTFINKIADCGVDVMAIPGNCDPAGICKAIGESGAFCLHNEIIGYGDAILFGYGGSNPTPFDTPGEIDDLKIYGDVFELMANYDYVYNKDVSKVKILVTHAPPFNTEADLTEGGDHVGSSGILKSIHEFEPQINICGHIHEAKSLSKIGITTDVANPGMLKNNGAVLIDIADGSTYDINIIQLDE